ncbi:agamous-like MADS-box protein AGL27 isoform X1 [Coffea arabica]|uniref:Agamous-like MADS-box protein AGL27 isoform X1 n=1 Tax=Coffea arabica TaxID=13443 RepID=A0A6P6V509_COFAR|nr:agamous-like MADS-box protein AGL27 [Coffea arabica]
MGRRKVEIKKIEDKNSRQVTFSKRRSGLMKKAKELSVLCDVDVAVLIFSGRGKLYDFCSTNSLAKILQRYHNYAEAEDGPARISGVEKRNPEGRNVVTIRKLLEKVERDLEEPDVDHLNLSELVQLEEQLEDALIQTRSRKTRLLMESITSLSEVEKMLREENKLLQNKVAAGTPNEKRNDLILEFGDLTHVGMISGQRQAMLELL